MGKKRNDQKGFTTRQEKEENSAARMKRHWESIGLRNRVDYEAWCREHAFPVADSKRSRMLSRERELARELAKRRSADAQQQSSCSGPKVLLHILQNSFDSKRLKHFRHQQFAELARGLQDSKSGLRCDRAAVEELLNHVIAQHCKFLDPQTTWRGDPQDDPRNGSVGFLGALVLIACHRRAWVRDLGNWKPRTRNATRQFRSLLHHLFVQHEAAPEFFDRVWLMGARPDGGLDGSTNQYRDWYRHVGGGGNLRTCKLPLAYTKRMAHFFLQAPSDVTVDQALIWGQVRGLGGDHRMADAIAVSRIAESLKNNEFWVSVIRWFNGQSMLDPSHVGPIVDYIHEQRFVCEDVTTASGEIVRGIPAQPNFTMNGRSVDGLLKQVESWHDALARAQRSRVAQWPGMGIDEFRLREGREGSEKSKLWTIRELRTSRDLATEGRKMRHCVATYARSCTSGSSSIWTMELTRNSVVDKLLTIEVRPRAGIIVQVRGRCNRNATTQEMKVLQRWATERRLSISSRLP